MKLNRLFHSLLRFLTVIILLLSTSTTSLAGDRPGAWCGWWLRKQLHVQDSSYNLARRWYNWGSATGPQIGAVVVWPHHVGLIVGKNSQGRWLVRSGNDGGKVKTRVWNLSKAKFRI